MNAESIPHSTFIPDSTNCGISIHWNTTQQKKGIEQHGRISKKPDQKTKIIYCMIPFIQSSRKHKIIYSDIKQISGCLGVWGRGKREDYFGEQWVYSLS